MPFGVGNVWWGFIGVAKYKAAISPSCSSVWTISAFCPQLLLQIKNLWRACLQRCKQLAFGSKPVSYVGHGVSSERFVGENYRMKRLLMSVPVWKILGNECEYFLHPDVSELAVAAFHAQTSGNDKLIADLDVITYASQ